MPRRTTMVVGKVKLRVPKILALFTGDLDGGREGAFSMFGQEARLWGAADRLEGRAGTRGNLNRLEKGADRNRLQFSKGLGTGHLQRSLATQTV